MKKLFTIAVAATMMCAAASQASAAALETSGQFRGRYWYLSDYNFTKGDAVDSSQDFFDQRLRLNMAYPATQQTTQYLKELFLRGSAWLGVMQGVI